MTLIEMAQLLGNFGEFVGSVAVVITLIFVGLQVRHGWRALSENTLLAKVAAADKSFEQHAEWRTRVINNEEVASLFLRGGRKETLSEEGQFRYQMLCLDWIFAQWRGYERSLAVKDHDLASELIRVTTEYASQYPGFREVMGMLDGIPAFQSDLDPFKRSLSQEHSE
jgi:hypothetical protein